MKSVLAIVGLGGLGYLGAQVALSLGAVVYGADPKDSAQQAVQRLGVARVVWDVRELVDERIDTMIDFAGVVVSTAGAVEAVRPGGRIVLVGLGASETMFTTLSFVVKSLTLVGSVGSNMAGLAQLIRMIADGRIKPIIESIGFDDIPDGSGRLERGEVTGRLAARIGG